MEEEYKARLINSIIKLEDCIGQLKIKIIKESDEVFLPPSCGLYLIDIANDLGMLKRIKDHRRGLE